MKPETLFENEYQQILLHRDLGAYEERFKTKSEELFGDSYIREVGLFGKWIAEMQGNEKPFSKLIINTLAGGPTMEPQVQSFMHEQFYPMLQNAGIKTKAYCLGEEIVSKLSVELTADNDPIKKFNYKYFSTLEEGIEWLKSM